MTDCDKPWTKSAIVNMKNTILYIDGTERQTAGGLLLFFDSFLTYLHGKSSASHSWSTLVLTVFWQRPVQYIWNMLFY